VSTNSSVASRRLALVLMLFTVDVSLTVAARAEDDLAAAIRAIPPRDLPAEEAAALREAVRSDVRARIKAAEDRESKGWYEVQTIDGWREVRKNRLRALAQSIGHANHTSSFNSYDDGLPSKPQADFEPRDLRTTSKIAGDGYTIENVIFTSRPGVVVAGNLYRPTESTKRRPAILICHSHHAPKTQGELQDMGMTWARSGVAVLVLDMLGHGERRTHEFAVAGKYPSDYKPNRQDYFFRYNTGLQLAAVGESLLGWMVHDLRCGATLLGTLPEVDPQNIILLGAVAGGGDPVGVAGALDWRFAAVVPFNFGGYEPENGFPLPDDAEQTFRYSGGTDWESTRSLRNSARDGFMPWTIVAATAPRRLVYAHEFRWDDVRDPVWKRLQKVYELYDQRDRLGTIVGHGGVKQSSAEASHCTNIGPVHRAQLYPLLEKWFALPVPKEYSARREPDELRALPKDFTPVPLQETVAKLAAERLADARRHRLSGFSRVRGDLRSQTAELLGHAAGDYVLDLPQTRASHTAAKEVVRDGLSISRFSVMLTKDDRSTELPLVVLRAAKEAAENQKLETRNQKRNDGAEKPTLVVAVAQAGKEQLLKERAEVFAACLKRGATVIVCDLSGTGELEPKDEGRGRTGGATNRSVAEQMLGETVLGTRVRDLRNILAFVRSQEEFKGSSIALYGESLTPANDPSRPIAAPLDASDLPKQSEPMGADVCLLTALFEDDISAVYAGGGLVSQAAILEAPYFYVPHDAIVPGLAAHMDLSDLLAAQQARVWTSDLRDGANRPIDEARRTRLVKETETFATAYKSPAERKITPGTPTATEIAEWLVR
jgi:dienelactone hydrolase